MSEFVHHFPDVIPGHGVDHRSGGSKFRNRAGTQAAQGMATRPLPRPPKHRAPARRHRLLRPRLRTPRGHEEPVQLVGHTTPSGRGSGDFPVFAFGGGVALGVAAFGFHAEAGGGHAQPEGLACGGERPGWPGGQVQLLGSPGAGETKRMSMSLPAASLIAPIRASLAVAWALSQELYPLASMSTTRVCS